jgi:hypothetical protein
VSRLSTKQRRAARRRRQHYRTHVHYYGRGVLSIDGVEIGLAQHIQIIMDDTVNFFRSTGRGPVR